jgi:hypothetical protein
MKAGTYQNDSLPRIVIVGGVLGVSAMPPDAKDGEVNIHRPHPSTPVPATALSGGDRQPGAHFTKCRMTHQAVGKPADTREVEFYLTDAEMGRRERKNLFIVLRKAAWRIKGVDGAAEL